MVRTSRTVHRYIIIKSLNFAEFLIKTCGSEVSSQVFVFLSAIVFFWSFPCDIYNNYFYTIIEQNDIFFNFCIDISETLCYFIEKI